MTTDEMRARISHWNMWGTESCVRKQGRQWKLLWEWPVSFTTKRQAMEVATAHVLELSHRMRVARMSYQPNDIAIDQLILENNARVIGRMYDILAQHTPDTLPVRRRTADGEWLAEPRREDT